MSGRFATGSTHSGIGSAFLPNLFRAGWGIETMRLFGRDDDHRVGGITESPDYFRTETEKIRQKLEQMHSDFSRNQIGSLLVTLSKLEEVNRIAILIAICSIVGADLYAVIARKITNENLSAMVGLSVLSLIGIFAIARLSINAYLSRPSSRKVAPKR